MTRPPTGTVTFLFTDIEGSTRLWEQHPDVMRPALARHDQLLHASIEGCGGFVFKTVGDAFCAAFHTAPEALAAALSAQRALAAEPWPDATPVRVRMALHTGAAEERGGDYHGPPLNRTARLLSAGHGGQTLLSDVARDLALDDLPPGASLADLGEHRLKDLGRPERVFQLLHPGLPADFPPLRSLDNPETPNNLPPQPTSFVGREREIGEVERLLGTARLLTLTGAGGCGKTRLALQAAAAALEQFADGAWLVELAPLSDPALVPQAVAQALGVKEQPGQTVLRTLLDWLGPKRLLLVLDNCEHLRDACASLASDILRAGPGVRVLATSREPLGVPGEQTYRVPSLAAPDPRASVAAEALSQYEAVALFVERAQAVQPSFSVTDANAPAVAQVCWHLDGIPLAIELAAARVRAMPVEQVMARLGQRFRLLTGGSRMLLPRQQTLRALIDWSYDLLNEPEKALLARLSVFAGGWTLEAAEAVCAGDPVEDWEVLDLLTSLVDKSLVVYEEPDRDDARYRLLETVRQYGAERLEADGEAEAVPDRHRDYFLALSERAELVGPEEEAWLNRLKSEHDNLRAALVRCGRPGGERRLLRLAGALWRFWDDSGHEAEGLVWLGRALEDASGVGGEAEGADPARAAALHGAGWLAYTQGDFTAGRTLLGESLEVRRRLGDVREVAHVARHLGILMFQHGDLRTAGPLLDEALTLYRQAGDPSGVGFTLKNLAYLTISRGDLAAGRALLEESLNVLRRADDTRGVAGSLKGLADLLAEQGDDLSTARAMAEEALGLFRRLGIPWAIAESQSVLGRVTVRQGDQGRPDLYPAARALFEECAAFYGRQRNPVDLAYALAGLSATAVRLGDHPAARAALRQSLTLSRQTGGPYPVAECLITAAQAAGQPERAARLLGAAAALREKYGGGPSPCLWWDTEGLAAGTRGSLGEAAFAAAWEAGRAMTWEQAVDYALAGTDRDAEPSGTPSGPKPAAPS